MDKWYWRPTPVLLGEPEQDMEETWQGVTWLVSAVIVMFERTTDQSVRRIHIGSKKHKIT